MKEDEILKAKKNSDDYLVEFIRAVVCEYYKMPELEFMEHVRSRKRKYCFLRQIIFLLIHENSEMTLMDISKIFGNHHATTIHGMRTIKELCEWDKKLNAQLQELREIVTLKSKAQGMNMNLDDDFYYIDLDEITSLKITRKKSMILTGFTKDEIDRMMTNLPKETQRREHNKTRMYILESKQNKTQE